MNVDEMGQTALNEAAKLVAMQVLGAGATVGSRVLQLFRRKVTNVETLNFAEIERLFLAAAAQDPDWAVEVIAAVADGGVGRRVLSCGLPPDPFRDRVGLVERVPERGVCVLAGRRGSGRTAAARQIAFARRDRFPRYGIEVECAKFRGSDGALAVVEVQRHILQQLGIDRDEQAEVEADLTAQYGSAMATRRVQLILRGVRSADELKPFEPTSFANPVLATTGYLGDDLRKDYSVVPLGGLDPEGAWQLLADRCGQEMLVAESAATRELLEICDYLPEPVRAVGGALSRRRGQAGAVSAKVEHLRSVGLADAIGAVRDSLDETFAELPPGAGTACARLAVHPGFDFDMASAGAVLGQDAENVVDALNDTSLLVNMGRGRWRLQYSVRQYARHLADDAGKVLEKLVNFFRDCAVYADDEDEEERLRVYPREPRGARPDIPGRLIDYLDSNRHVILDLEHYSKLVHRAITSSPS